MLVANNLNQPLAVLNSQAALKALSSQALTLDTSVRTLTVPASAKACQVQLGNGGGTVRCAYSLDGTAPVVDTTGFRAANGTRLYLFGAAMAAFKYIASGSTTGWVEYYQ